MEGIRVCRKDVSVRFNSPAFAIALHCATEKQAQVDEHELYARTGDLPRHSEKMTPLRAGKKMLKRRHDC